MANYKGLGNPTGVNVEVDENKSYERLAFIAIQPCFKDLTCKQAVDVAWYMEYAAQQAVEEYKISQQQKGMENIVKNASASLTGLVNAFHQNSDSKQ